MVTLITVFATLFYWEAEPSDAARQQPNSPHNAIELDALTPKTPISNMMDVHQGVGKPRINLTVPHSTEVVSHPTVIKMPPIPAPMASPPTMVTPQLPPQPISGFPIARHY
mmetsp:Transcript_53078/g.115271  ORF Transcript_53078/g.115271 Transcript_53078/m.115271 type:complete len:111 (-) Transcript_53078:57-389(-)